LFPFPLARGKLLARGKERWWEDGFTRLVVALLALG